MLSQNTSSAINYAVPAANSGSSNEVLNRSIKIESKSLTDLSAYTHTSQITSICALPYPILVQILQQVDEGKSKIMLSTTCKLFNRIYQDDKIQNIQNIYRTLKSEFSQQHDLNIPKPNAEEWQKLKLLDTHTRLIDEEHQSVLMKKAYIDSWDLLLQLKVPQDRSQVAKLMKQLLSLLPHIHKPQEYAAKLFPVYFPEKLFKRLIEIHMDRGLQLVVKHFPIQKDSPAYKFIVNNYPYINAQDLKALQEGVFPSFLHCALAISKKADAINDQVMARKNKLLNALLKEIGRAHV